jgi:chemotaxis protein MotB
MARDRSAVNLTVNLPSDAPVSEPNEQDPETKRSEEDERQQSPGVLDREQVEAIMNQEKVAAEQKQLTEAENELRQAIQAVPELRDLAQNMIVEQTPEGLRIQIVDQAKLSMFPLGGADMYEHTRKLMAAVVAAIKDLPQRIDIKGHTDASPYSSKNGYSNWELSADRANASRRALVEAGLPESRIQSVTGRAAQEPLLPEDPLSPQNRRISITLLRDAPTQLAGGAGDGRASAGPQGNSGQDLQDPATLLERDE